MARTRRKSGITTSATKGPLQDITDHYNPLCSTQSSVNRCSTPDPRRKPNPMALTSLPPSSPPSTSSRPFIVHTRPVSPFVQSEKLESEPDDPRFDTTAAPGANSDADPFGFFALENKLRIFRRNQQHAKPAPSSRVQLVTSDFVNSPTPSTRRNERENIASPISFGKDDSEPDTILRTSLNAVSKKGKERASAKGNSIPKVELATNTLETPAPCQKANPQRRNVKAVPVAPSRRLSLRTGVTAKPRKNASRGRTREQGGRVSPAELLLKNTRQKSRVKKPAEPTSSSVTDAKDRQARLDYFKKLEDYQLEKENVYVI